MRRRRPERCYEPVLHVVEIMLTLVTVNEPLLALALALGLVLDGDVEDGDPLGSDVLSIRPVSITW
jgi:hypothetical protein